MTTTLGTPTALGHRVLPRHRRLHAGGHLLGREAHAIDEGVLRRGPERQRLAERPRPGRRLHERRLVPRHHGPGRAQGLRRDDLRDRLAGGMAGPDVPHRRAAAQPRQVHLRRRGRVPPPADAGADRVGGRRHPDRAVLHDRPDGRVGQPDQADVRHLVRGGRRHRRRDHDGLRAVRRDDRDHLGADHQGRAAAVRRHGDDRPRARAVRLQPRRAVRRGRRAVFAVGARTGRARDEPRRCRVAGPGADVRPAGPAAHPDALLHRARRACRAPVGVVRDGVHRLLLHHHSHRRASGRLRSWAARSSRRSTVAATWRRRCSPSTSPARRSSASSPRSRSPRSSPWWQGSRWPARRRCRTTSTRT